MGYKLREYIAHRDRLAIYAIEQVGGQPVSSRHISEYLSDCGFDVPAGQIHSIVRKIKIETGLPICSKNRLGYYLTTDKKEVQNCINDLQSRIKAISQNIAIFEKYMATLKEENE